jgi:hypothetical protein
MYWSGYNKFTDGGNNGWVGLYANCEGKWTIYAYGNFWFSVVQMPARPEVTYNGTPGIMQRLSSYKTSNGGCDPEGSGVAQAIFVAWGGPWGVSDVIYLPFDLAVTVERVESFSMPSENPVAVNPFP